jgi:hypothetical protein
VERGSFAFCEPPARARAQQQHLLSALLLFTLADHDALAGGMIMNDLPVAGWSVYAFDDG